MELRHRQTPGLQNRLHCVEPLEDRRLLSGPDLLGDPPGVPQTSAADTAPSTQAIVSTATAESSTQVHGAVEVVSFGVATDDGDGGGEIAPAQLPHEIIAALVDRFPEAELVGAEWETVGDTSVYEVTAAWGGLFIDVTLTSDGTIIETKQTLAAGELPQPVLEWVRQNLPGAVIDEAELVTQSDIVSYDLRIATSGRQDFEVSLRVQDAGTQVASSRVFDRIGLRLDSASATFDTATLRTAGPAAQSDTTSGDGQPESETLVKPESPETATPLVVIRDASHEQAESHRANSIRTVSESDLAPPHQASVSEATTTPAVRNFPATPAAIALQALIETVASGSATAWLPQVGGVLGDVLPIDVAALERGLQQFLDELDSVAEKVTGDTTVTSAALRLAVIAGLITGAELVIHDSRKPVREPMLESSAANSSWSWVLGAATPKRS